MLSWALYLQNNKGDMLGVYMLHAWVLVTQIVNVLLDKKGLLIDHYDKIDRAISSLAFEALARYMDKWLEPERSGQDLPLNPGLKIAVVSGSDTSMLALSS